MAFNRRMQQWQRASEARSEIVTRLERGEALTRAVVTVIGRSHHVSDSFVTTIVPRSNRIGAQVDNVPIRMTRYRGFQIITSLDLAEPDTALERVKRQIDALQKWR